MECNPVKRKFGAFVLLLLAVSALMAQKQPRVTGFFSNMQYAKEAGDVVGMEVWIVYARGSYWATVQVAQGEPEPPVVVPVQVSGSRVTFSLREQGTKPDGTPAEDFVTEFVGTVSGTALILSSGTEREILKRGASYWQ
jgi:hypothetical protein